MSSWHPRLPGSPKLLSVPGQAASLDAHSKCHVDLRGGGPPGLLSDVFLCNPSRSQTTADLMQDRSVGFTSRAKYIFICRSRKPWQTDIQAIPYQQCKMEKTWGKKACVPQESGLPPYSHGLKQLFLERYIGRWPAGQTETDMREIGFDQMNSVTPNVLTQGSRGLALGSGTEKRACKQSCATKCSPHALARGTGQVIPHEYYGTARSGMECNHMEILRPTPSMGIFSPHRAIITQLDQINRRAMYLPLHDMPIMSRATYGCSHVSIALPVSGRIEMAHGYLCRIALLCASLIGRLHSVPLLESDDAGNVPGSCRGTW